jgi:lipopolysaccharide/colanic/teichoic acid biosynthesis glycosyltransferase
MIGGWRYRFAAMGGTILLTAATIALVNNDVVLKIAAALPLLGRLATPPPHGVELVFEVTTATAVFVASLIPLYKPRPRRILDTVTMTQQRVLLAMFALATIGYFDYTYRLPRLTVLLATPILLVVLPAWFVRIRRRPSSGSARAIVVGDDPDQIVTVIDDLETRLFGYLCPSRVPAIEKAPEQAAAVADGGRSIGRLGGLSRIEDILVDYDIDTVFLAFEDTDRAEFFGALDACYEHGVAAKVHRDHVDSVLTAEGEVGTFVDVDIEPWDVQDYLAKRALDIAFSVIGLTGFLPVMLVIAGAIRLDDGGSLLYRQERTAVFGETFTVFKFRSMSEGAESGSGPTLSDEDAGGTDPRVTRVGRVLRQTHLDEIPQLWSVLLGDMSMVGPRPERPSLDGEMELGTDEWRSRWFVKPGLTGLAQIRDVTGHEPAEKLRYDLEYIRRQSFWLDLKIVVRQLWKVGSDAIAAISPSNGSHR